MTSSSLPIYLDHAATTPCDPRVIETMMPYFGEWFGNASSRNHLFGWRAEEAVDQAREQVADLVQANKKEIVFTSGATEAVNLALKGVFEKYQNKGNHIITCNIEHKAVLDTCHYLETIGADVTYLQADHSGRIELDQLAASFRPDTILVAIMYANNELGIIHPIRTIAQLARQNDCLLFTDASQAAGKIPIHVAEDSIDLMAFSAHKIYGPKGAGALYVKRRNPAIQLAPQAYGGGHERGLRSGTLNVPAIVGFGKACEIASQEMESEARRLGALRKKLETAILALGGTKINGGDAPRLPHITNISFEGVEGEKLLNSLNRTLAVSSGSACTSATMEPSYVLKAIGLPDELAHASVRFGLGRFNSGEQVDFAIEEVSRTLNLLRDDG